MKADNDRAGSGANAKTALEAAVQELYQKYSLGERQGGGGGMRSGADAEAELTQQLHNAELKNALLGNKLEVGPVIHYPLCCVFSAVWRVGGPVDLSAVWRVFVF